MIHALRRMSLLALFVASVESGCVPGVPVGDCKLEVDEPAMNRSPYTYVNAELFCPKLEDLSLEVCLQISESGMWKDTPCCERSSGKSSYLKVLADTCPSVIGARYRTRATATANGSTVTVESNAVTGR
jgi:hypothetical protein